MFLVAVRMECVFSLKNSTAFHARAHTHTLSKRGVYSGDHSCCNWGKKVGQGRCHADINNSVQMVRAQGGRVGVKLARANPPCPVFFYPSYTLGFSFVYRNI